MKFKSIFLGMLGAAALVSCNNESAINPDEQVGGNGYAGETTYATFQLNLGQNASTYAGDGDLTSTLIEKNIQDAAMYVYKFDGANMTPEAMAYVTTANGLVAATPRVTMMVKSGQKKIFLACNIGNATSALLDNNSGTATFIARPDTGIDWTSTAFTSLNWILESNATSATHAATMTAPTSTSAGEANLSDGLIKTLAGGSMTTSKGIKLSKETLASDAAFLMTNWDGLDDKTDGGGTVHTSDCLFTLVPNVSAADSKTAGNDNNLSIGVQHAIAKISVRITADGTTTNTSNTYYGPYESSENDGSKGRFTPWTGTGSKPVWVLGGINKRQYPFMTETGTNNAIASPNYADNTGDTVYYSAVSGTSVADAVSILWYGSYDNTRVYGTGQKYGTTLNTVTNVKTTMQVNNNNLEVSTADATGTTAKPFNVAYCTENGTEFPQWQSRGTYVVFGGTYTPKNVLTGIQNPSVTTNPAEKAWNGATPVAGQANTGYDANTYTYTPSSGDTLYYLVGSKVFIAGQDNLAKYYAWELKFDKDNASPTISTPVVAAQINNSRANNQMFAYLEGQCFYRVWVQDPSASTTSSYVNQYLIRRNHVYDVNISKIKGPGIADPNKIINPIVIPELDTFVTAEIKVLDWHKVTSAEEVSYE